MVVGFITTYAISTYQHKRCEFESHSGEVYSIQHYVIKFVSDLRHAGRWISPGTPVSSTNKTDRHDIIEIFLNVALNTIALIIHLIKINGNTLLIFCKNIFDTTSNFCVFVFVHFRALKEYGSNLVWWHYVSVLGGDVKRHLHVVVFLFFFNFHSPIWALTACFDIYVCIIT